MRFYVLLGCVALAAVLWTGQALAQEEAAETPAPAEEASVEAPPPGSEPLPDPKELTLYKMLKEGGAILWVIVGLSVMTLILILYCFLTVTPGREVPGNFVKRALSQISSGDLRGAYQMCDGRDEILANVFRAGLKMAGHDRYVIQEAMESEGERAATALWQKISYIKNMGEIAPLLGLLGTVVGMIRAFGAIALEDSQVKGLTMAYSVSQAMITTAAGLMLAIPALMAYYYLRGRVVKIIAEVEAHASEVVEMLTRGNNQ